MTRCDDSATPPKARSAERRTNQARRRAPTPAYLGAASTSLRRVLDSHEVVAKYWTSAEARRWDEFAALVAEDLVYEAPQTRERVRGRDAYIRFNIEGFPGEWHLVVERIVAEGPHAVSWVEFTADGKSQPGLCFFELNDEGKIAKITDFWPDPYDLPPSRAHLVERY